MWSTKLCCFVSGCKKNSTVLTDHLNNNCPSKQDTFQCSLCYMSSTDCKIMIYCHYTGDKSYHCLDCTGTFSTSLTIGNILYNYIVYSN